MLTQKFGEVVEANLESYVTGLSYFIDGGAGSSTLQDTSFTLFSAGSLTRKDSQTIEINTGENRLTIEHYVASTEWNHIRGEYYQPSSNDYEGEYGSGASAAMSFESQFDNIGSAIAVKVKYTGGKSGASWLYVEGDTAGYPDGTAVASGTIANWSGTAAWKTVTLNTQPTLTSGTPYWVVLKADDAATGAYAFVGDISGTYTRGDVSGAVADAGFELYQDRLTETAVFAGSEGGSAYSHLTYDTPIQKNPTVELQIASIWDYSVNVNV